MEIQAKFNSSMYIKYGDIVSISDITKGKQIIYSDGFIRLNIQVSNISQQVITNDFHGCIFRILPNYTYDYYEKQERLIKFINEKDVVQHESNFKYDNIKEQYNILLAQLQDEIEINLNQCNFLMNSNISQGQFLQFQHFKSKKYLTLDPLESIPNYKDSYALTLKDKPSRYSIFKIIQSYAYQYEFSSKIKYEEDIFILCQQQFKAQDLYLAVSDKKKSKQTNKMMDFESLGTTNMKDRFQMLMEFHSVNKDDTSQISEDPVMDFFYNSDVLFGNFQEKSKFRISCFNNDPDFQQIFMNDCLWIIHIDCYSALIYNSEQEQSLTESVYFQQFNLHKHKNTMGLWKIEVKNIKSGAKFQCTEKIRFKNLHCNKYMSIQEQGGKKQIVLDVEGGIDSLFEIIPYQNYDQEIHLKNYISTSKVFFIRHHKTQQYLSKQPTNKEERLHGFTLKPYISKRPGQDDYFKFIKAQDSEIFETLFLQSCKPPLLKGLSSLTKITNIQLFKDTKYLIQSDERTFKEMKQCLLLLKDFCSNNLLQKSDEFQYQEEQFVRKQKILMEQGYFRILFMIIKNCFPNKEIIHKFLEILDNQTVQDQSASHDDAKSVKSKQKQIMKLINLKKYSNNSFIHLKNQYVKEYIQITDLCFQLIQKMCQQNYFNQIICFKYNELIKNQVGYVFGATKCIMETIVNNEQLLNLIHSNNIEKDYQALFYLTAKQNNQKKNGDRDQAEFKQLKRFFTTDEKGALQEGEGENQSLIHNVYASYKESLQQHKHKHLIELINFMNCLCDFKDEGISLNQIVIKNLIIEDKQIFVPIRLNSSNQLEIAKLEKKEYVFYDFIEYFEKSFQFEKQQDENSLQKAEEVDEIVYFQKIFSLFSNLCKGRNYNNIKYFRQIFTSQSLISCIWNENIPQQIRASLTEVLHSVHIDSKPRSERVIPMLTRIAIENPPSIRNSVEKVEVEVKKGIAQKKNILQIMIKQVSKLKQIVQSKEKTFEEQKQENLQSLKKAEQQYIELTENKKKSHNIIQKQPNDIDEKDVYEYLLEDDSLSEKDTENLKNKLIEYFNNDIFMTKMNDKGNQKYVIFNQISLNMIILVRKLIKYNFFELQSSELKTNNRLERMQSVIDNKFQTQNAFRKVTVENPFQKLIKAFLQILKVDIQDKLAIERNSQLIVSQTLKGFMSYQKKMNKSDQKQLKKDKLIDFEKEIKSMVMDQMNQFLQKEDNNEKDSEHSWIENSVKIELVRNLVYYGELKHDFYIENIFEFIKISMKECENQLSDVNFIEKHIEKNLKKYMPMIMSNGIGKFVKNKQDSHDLNDIMGESILPLLIQHFYTSSNQLYSFLTLRLITQNYNQRANLIKELKHLQIIQDPTELNIFIEARTKAIQLNFDAEQSEIWLQNLQSGKGEISGKIIVHRIIDNLQSMIDYSYSDPNNISINRQIMLRNIKIHEIVIQLLKDCNYKMKYYNQYQKHNQSDVLISDVFKHCYKFLQVFIKNNNRLNITLLTQDYETLYMQLSYFELGQTQFFSILYHQNYDLISKLDPDLIFKFVDKIKNFGHSPKFINFMEIVMYYRGDPFYPNWDKILDIILDHKILFQLLMIRKNQKFINQNADTDNKQQDAHVIKMIREFARSEKEEDKVVEAQSLGQFLFDLEDSDKSKNVPYIYHYLFLRLFNKLIEFSVEKQQIAYSLFSKILDINYLFYLVTKKDIFDSNFYTAKNCSIYILNTFLKQECLRIIYVMYLKTNQSIKQLQNNSFLIQFLQQEIYLLVRFHDHDTINKMVQTFQSIRTQYFAEKKNQNKINMNDEILSKYNKYIEDLTYNFIEYVFSFMLPIITILFQSFILSQAEQSTGNNHNREDVILILKYTKQFEIFFTKLQINQSLLKNFKQYNKIVKNIQEFQIIKDWDLNIIKQDKQQEEKEQIIIKHFVNVDVMVDIPLQDIIMQRNINLENVNEVGWRSLVLSMLQSKCIQEKFIETEQNALIDAILNIQEFSTQSLQISLSTFIKQLFQFIQDTIFQRYDVKGFLKQEIRQMDKLAEETILIIINIVKRNREEMQKIFLNNGIINNIAKIMCKNKISEKKFFLLIDLSNELLEKGGKELQDQYLLYFQTENNGEQLFSRFHKLFLEEIDRVQSYQTFTMRVKQINKKINYCYRPDKDHRIIRMMRYFQLLCEGHNTNFQIYIRVQQNSMASQRTNYDMLKLFVKLIDIYFNNLNEDNYHKISQTFDTIIEIIQGPCEENQQALSGEKLLESLLFILQQKEAVSNVQKQQSSSQIIKEKEIVPQKNQQISLDLEENFIKFIENISPNFADHISQKLKSNGKEKKQWMITRLKYKSLLTLEALLEGNSNYSILKKVQQTIPLTLIKKNIIQVYQNFLDIYKNRYVEEALTHLKLPIETPQGEKDEIHMQKLTFIIQNGFQFYYLQKKYQEMYVKNNISEIKLDQNEDSKDLEPQKQQEEAINDQSSLISRQKGPSNQQSQNVNEKSKTQYQREKYSAGLKFFEENTGYIEIYKDQKTFKQYFTLLPFCLCLTKNDKATFNQNIDRISTKTKLHSLQSIAQDLIYSMKYEYQLRQKIQDIKPIYFLWENINKLQIIAFLFSIIENLFVLFYTEYDHKFTLQPLLFKERGPNQLIKYLYIIITCQVIVMVLNFIIFIFYSLKIVPMIKKQYEDEISKLEGDQNLIKKFIILIETLQRNPYFLYRIFFTIFVCLGYFNEFFIAFQLMDVFFQLPMLLTVIRSVWRPKKQLLVTIVWMIILEFYFSLILYYFLYEEFVVDGIDVCSELLSCFSMIVDVTLKSDGGFTGFNMPPKNYYYQWTFNSFSTYAFVYNFTIYLLTLQIMTGIIIDTFAILRQEEDNIQKDISNVCFICGEQRHILDKRDLKKGYNHHIQYVHRTQDYIFYIAYLLEKDQTEMSGIESYVFQKYQNKNVDWFPVNESETQCKFY